MYRGMCCTSQPNDINIHQLSPEWNNVDEKVTMISHLVRNGWREVESGKRKRRMAEFSSWFSFGSSNQEPVCSTFGTNLKCETRDSLKDTVSRQKTAKLTMLYSKFTNLHYPGSRTTFVHTCMTHCITWLHWVSASSTSALYLWWINTQHSEKLRVAETIVNLQMLIIFC